MGITTDKKITDLRVAVDHISSCFNVNFRVPESINLAEAQSSTYVLSYYKTDLSTTLNTIPYQKMKCSIKKSANVFLKSFSKNLTEIRCFVELCSKREYQFEPVTQYTFRASMILDNAHTIITSLSESIDVVSWDSCKFLKNIKKRCK